MTPGLQNPEETPKEPVNVSEEFLDKDEASEVKEELEAMDDEDTVIQ